jgi:hypothetical protein
MHRAVLLACLGLSACSGSDPGYGRWRISGASGEFEIWKDGAYATCEADPNDNNLLLGTALSAMKSGVEASWGLLMAWPGKVDQEVSGPVKFTMTTVVENATGGAGTIRLAIGPVLEGSLEGEPSTSRFRKLHVLELRLPAQRLGGETTKQPYSIAESLLTDGTTYCLDHDATDAAQGY